MKYPFVSVFAFLLPLFFCTSPPVVQAEETISLFDIRYTLRSDWSVPEKMNEAWDHVHTAATLQGIVNRHKPRLYYFAVENNFFDK